MASGRKHLSQSLPTRERGLKSPAWPLHPPQWHVAPHAGAWIEIVARLFVFSMPPVAPHAGAWIEITFVMRSPQYIPSLPTRERGLKSQSKDLFGAQILVAPHAGAWIEIEDQGGDSGGLWSLPTRERGLKSDEVVAALTDDMSLPTRERGLKSQVRAL